MRNLAAILLVVNIMHAQDCNADEVEIWGWCYHIENTTILQNTDNTSWDFPNEICELINIAKKRKFKRSQVIVKNSNIIDIIRTSHDYYIREFIISDIFNIILNRISLLLNICEECIEKLVIVKYDKGQNSIEIDDPYDLTLARNI